MMDYKGRILKIHTYPHEGTNYEIVSRKEKTFREGNRTPDAVKIVALWKGSKLVVINEFRPQINDWILDIPAGKLDPGEDVETCAVRELKEETGLTVTRITHVFYHSFPSVGMTDEQQAMVFCEVEGELSSEFLQDHEKIQPMLIDIPSLRRTDSNRLIATQLATIIGVLDYILVE